MLAVASPAFADFSSGFPNDCVGFGTSYAAQGNPIPIPGVVSANGIGNLAKANDVSVKDVMGYTKGVLCG